MADVTLTLRGAEVAGPPQTVDENYFVVLRDCLSASQLEIPPLHQYVERIDALTRSPAAPQDGDADVEAHLDAFWNVLLGVVGQIQVDEMHDKRMETSANLVIELSKLDSGCVEIWGTNMKLWEDLPLLGPVLRDNWNGPDEHLPEEKYPAWVLKNAFVARLVTLLAKKGTKEPPFLEFPVWTLRGALEEEFKTPTPDFVSARVVASVFWFKYAGGFLLEQSVSEHQTHDEMFARVTQPGKLFQGPPGMSLERFKFWRARLEELSHDSGDERVKKLAKEAAEIAANLLDGFKVESQ